MTPAAVQHRLFFALWPDPAVASALLQRQSGIEGKLVDAHNLHLTLAFLGQRCAHELPALSRILQRVPAPAPVAQAPALAFPVYMPGRAAYPGTRIRVSR